MLLLDVLFGNFLVATAQAILREAGLENGGDAVMVRQLQVTALEEKQGRLTAVATEYNKRVQISPHCWEGRAYQR